MSGYKISRFTVNLPVEEAGDQFAAVYHGLTRAFMLIPMDQWKSVTDSNPDADPKTVEMLTDQGILVGEGVDETVVFRQWKARHVHGSLLSYRESQGGMRLRCLHRDQPVAQSDRRYALYGPGS